MMVLHMTGAWTTSSHWTVAELYFWAKVSQGLELTRTSKNVK
jgi:hypothetical protein